MVYMDDIGIFSRIWEEHKSHLELMLQRILSAGLTIKAAKCLIGNSEIKYLGHLVEGGTIKPLYGRLLIHGTSQIPKRKSELPLN